MSTALKIEASRYPGNRIGTEVIAEQAEKLEALGLELNHLSKTDGWDQMADLVEDDTVRLFAAVGTHDELPEVRSQRFGGLVDTIAVAPLPDIDLRLPPDLIHDIRAIATPSTTTRDRRPT